jgi:CreA protein
MKSGLKDEEDVFDERRSLLFKKLHVVRFYDKPNNTLVYLSYSDRIIEGSPKNAVSTVPIMPWGK